MQITQVNTGLDLDNLRRLLRERSAIFKVLELI